MTKVLDLSIATLIAACKGNENNLPTFMVHNNEAWPKWTTVALDSKNRIHMRRTTFLNLVATEIPVRAGLWHRTDCQEFHIDLEPHHLQGSADMGAAEDYKHSRAIILADDHGRMPDDRDYKLAPPAGGTARSELAALPAEIDGERRGVSSTILDAGGSE